MIIYGCSSRAGKLVILENGECRCDVILTDNPSEHIRRAADEFCLHVEKVANIEVPVFKASQVRNVPEGFNHVLIGESPLTRELGISTKGLEEEQFRIFADKHTLAFLGYDNIESPATMWAVCDYVTLSWKRTLCRRIAVPSTMGEVFLHGNNPPCSSQSSTESEVIVSNDWKW